MGNQCKAPSNLHHPSSSVWSRPRGPALGSEVTRTGRPLLTLKPIFVDEDAFPLVFSSRCRWRVSVEKWKRQGGGKDKAAEKRRSSRWSWSIRRTKQKHKKIKMTCLRAQKHDELHHRAAGLHTHQTWRFKHTHKKPGGNKCVSDKLTSMRVLLNSLLDTSRNTCTHSNVHKQTGII